MLEVSCLELLPPYSSAFWQQPSVRGKTDSYLNVSWCSGVWMKLGWPHAEEIGPQFALLIKFRLGFNKAVPSII